jgi:NADH:ubiquinone oxidoreductase subunit K
MGIEVANILRFVVVSEIAFSLGFLAVRWYHRRPHWQYLSLMSVGLALYSVFAAFVLVSRYNQPMSWRLPLVFAAASVTIIAVIREGVKK